MYYIEKDNKILFFDTDREKLENTLVFTPQYKDLEIKETDRPIVDFEFADTEEYKARKAEKDRQLQIEEIKEKLAELDTKRIRAICENEIKDEQSGQTWLDYYNSQVLELRNQLSDI